MQIFTALACGTGFLAAGRRCSSLVVLCLLGSLASAAAAQVDDRIEQVIGSPEYQHASWGLLVADLSSGDVLYERNADKLFAPASTTKLYSVAAALDALGSDYRFETPIYARGDLNSAGELDG